MLIGQLWSDIQPLPLFKDELLQIFWTRLPKTTRRIPVQLLNNKYASIGNSKFEILLFHKN